MRPGLWTGFFLLEPRTPDLTVVASEVGRLKRAGFPVGELDERNAFALFTAPDKRKARENANALASFSFFTQLHAPKPVENLQDQVRCEVRILEACEIMGVRTVVAHPFIAESPEKEPRGKNLEYLDRFVREAEGRQIRIALENQIYSVDMAYYLSEIPGLYVNLDFAHAIAIGKSVVRFIEVCGSRLAGLHVADSDGRAKDWHIMPGQGILNWLEVVSALRRVNYTGDFHLEIVHERTADPARNDRTAARAFDIVSQILGKE